MRRFFLLLSLLCTTAVSAQTNKSIPAVEVASDPAMMIHGCVNAMTGNYTEGGTPLSFAGASGLNFQYRYNSGDTNTGSMTGSWWHNIHLSCRLRVYNDQDYVGDRGNWYIETVDESGIYKMYHTDYLAWFKHGDLRPPKRNLHATTQITDFKYGYANTALGEIAGRTHLANEVADYHDRNHTVRIEQSDGTVDEFIHCGYLPYGTESYYGHKTRFFPQGMRWEYWGAAQGTIKGIEVRDGADQPTGQHLEFVGDAKRKETFDWKIQTNDGRWVRFTGRRVPHGAEPQIHEISSSHGPTIHYSYKPSEKLVLKRGRGRYDFYIPERMVRRDLPDGRYLHIDYYHRGINRVAGQEINLPAEDRQRMGKVQRLVAPAGSDDSGIALYEFLYDVSVKVGDTTYAKVTEVLDCQKHKTQYALNENGRLAALLRYTGTQEYTLHSVERLHWGENETVCNLISRTLEEADGTLRSCQHYKYDAAHNPVEESSWGNLSGHCTIPPVVEEGKPTDNGCECYTIQREYSQDRFHNKTQELYPNGQCTRYQYKPDTNLCTGVFCGTTNTILQRTFSRYDDNGVAIETIEDDGSSCQSEDLSDVTYRRITRIRPVVDASNFGLPAEVAHYYLDLPSKQEVLLNKVVYQYSREGWVTQEDHYDAHDELRFSLQREFDSMGNTILEQDALGQLTRRRFDANGNKVWEQGPDHEFHLEFRYDFSDRLIAEEIVLQDGTRYTKSFRYDYLGNKIAEVDIHGQETRYEYDDLHRLTATHRPVAYDGLGQALAATVRESHDISGNVTETVDALGNATRMSHTIRGQLASIRHPDGKQEHKYYHLNGTLKREVAVNGSYTDYLYDVFDRVIGKEIYSADGELLSTVSYEYKGTQLQSETDANGNVTYYEYDGAGRKIGVRTDNSYQQIEYDALGRLHKSTVWADDQHACVSIKEYDLLGRVIEERIEDLDGVLCTRVTYIYDHRGHLTEETHYTAEGPASTRKEYDALGRVVRIIDPEGNEAVTDYNDWHVNAHGQKVQQITVTDALGRQTITTHNAWDQPISVVKKDPYGLELSKHELGYDAKGQMTTRIDTVKLPQRVDRTLHTRWTYDSCGRCIQLDEAVGTDEARSTRTLYNRFGEKEAVAYDDGTVLKYEYDSLGRLARYWATDDSFNYAYRYDAVGNVLEVNDELLSTFTKRSYDSQGRMTTEQLANGTQVDFEYDGLGRVTRYTLPDHSSVAYQYQAANLKQVCRCDASGNAVYTHIYSEHDLSGRCLKQQLVGQAGTVTTEYDLCGRITLLTAPSFSEVVPPDGYDAIGNLRQKQRTDALGSVQCNYGYDPLNQLTSEEGVQSHRYLFDSLHNRVQVDDQTCRVNALNQLLIQGDTQYSYDAKGNRLNDGETTYGYDALGRMISVQRDDQRWEYEYDGFNRRLLRRSYNGEDLLSEERFLYQGQNELGTLDVEGQITQFRMLGQGKGAEIGAAVLIQTPEGSFAPIHDPSGHVVALIDAETGQTQEVLRYSAFGLEELYGPDGQQREVSATGNPWRFASKRNDSETGFLNFGRRYYDPQTGRWLTPDPRGFDDGPNLYAYVHNSPLTHIDEYGLLRGRDRRNRSVRRFRSVSRPRCPSPLWVAHRGSRTLCRQVGRGVEGFGRHCMLPYFQAPFVATGRLMQGQGLTLPKRYDCDHSHWYRYAGKLNGKIATAIFTGVNNTYEDSVNAASEHQKDMGGIPVITVYNSTHGLFSDLTECVLDIMGIPSKSVQDGVAGIRAGLAGVGGVGGGGRLLIKVHSQGARHCQRCINQLTPKERAMIDVAAYGPARIISAPGLGSSVNYISRCDFVTALADPFGYTCAVLGLRSDVEFIGPRFANPFQEHQLHYDTYRKAAQREAFKWLIKYGR